MTRILTLTDGLTMAVDGIDVRNIPLDGLKRLKVSQSHTELTINLSGESGDRLVVYDQVSGNGGNAVLNNSSSSALLSVNNGRSLVRFKSRDCGFYQLGKSLSIFQYFKFPSPQSGLICRVGYKDNNNGVFLEQDGNTISEITLITSHLLSDSTHSLDSEKYHPLLINEIKNRDYQAIADWYQEISTIDDLGELINLMRYQDKSNLSKLEKYQLWHSQFALKIHNEDSTLMTIPGFTLQFISEQEKIIHGYISGQNSALPDKWGKM